ncbi:profilin-2-like isoform X2 [Gigantopelta aegis]|uniref:profilin-2-like isoform X2 n=1 Tax=Gigantopelta aegis TaxID=1735272 RepID=UPI001B88DE9E|nr:profilin-2-like isoform X2 [Gigantopelta aegis]
MTLELPTVTWDDYIYDVLISSGNGGYVSKAGIYNTDGQKWAASEDLDIHSSEIRDIVAAFDDCSKIRKTGIRLGCRVFTLTRITDRRVLVGRESKSGAGVVAFRCESCVVLGVCEEGASQAGCYTMVMKLGDYLTDMGY